jgi:hypothetical protein
MEKKQRSRRESAQTNSGAQQPATPPRPSLSAKSIGVRASFCMKKKALTRRSLNHTWSDGEWTKDCAHFAKKNIVLTNSAPELAKLAAKAEDGVAFRWRMPEGSIVQEFNSLMLLGYRIISARTLLQIVTDVRTRVLRWAQEVAKRIPKPTRARPIAPRNNRPNNNRVFIVHGHNHSVRDAIDLYLTKDLGMRTLVMQAGASGGRHLHPHRR